MKFQHIDFKDKSIFPSGHLPQWKCLYKLIEKQTRSDKMAALAQIGACATCTLSLSLRKTLTVNQNIIAPSIARRISEWYGDDEILYTLCPAVKKVQKK